MRAVISIPDDVYRQAEQAAARLGLSRSAFYARAVAEYVARRSQPGVTERLDAVYREVPARLDPLLAAMQLASLPADEW
jgi:hypothetical protein